MYSAIFTNDLIPVTFEKSFSDYASALDWIVQFFPRVIDPIVQNVAAGQWTVHHPEFMHLFGMITKHQ